MAQQMEKSAHLRFVGPLVVSKLGDGHHQGHNHENDTSDQQRDIQTWVSTVIGRVDAVVRPEKNQRIQPVAKTPGNGDTNPRRSYEKNQRSS